MEGEVGTERWEGRAGGRDNSASMLDTFAAESAVILFSHHFTLGMSILDRASAFRASLAIVHSFQNPPRRSKSVTSFRLWTVPLGANPPVGTSDEQRVLAVMVAPMAGEDRLPSTTKHGTPLDFELSQRTDAPFLAEPFSILHLSLR